MSLTLPRLYPIVDTAVCDRFQLHPEALAAAFLEAGVQILQFRHKGPYLRPIFAQAEALAALCQTAKVRYVINDRADIAAILGADLHLGQDDLPPAQARKVTGPAPVIGFSTHNEAQFAEATQDTHVNYLALGPIFDTASKQNPDPVVGLSRLAAIAATKHHPLVAIGGITLETAPAVYQAGADSIAVISALIPPQNPKLDAIRRLTAQWLNPRMV
ncbi:hypothetical protein F183_A49640 [Bryobacterales bacterium F-183]|nr:hypothetical protein F183_A49640 [Bryobacterales bacterium F-183]